MPRSTTHFTKPTPSSLLLTNARIIDPASGRDELGGILVKNGIIEDIGTHLKDAPASNQLKVIDCNGHVLCPGLLDIQVHLRTPGQEHKEDITTGTQAAAAGGVTTVVCMANTTPTIDSPEVLKQLQDICAEHAYVNVHSYASMTKNLAGQELTDIAALKKAGAIGISDDGKPLMNSLLMRRAMEQAKEHDLLIAQHAEDIILSDGGCINEGVISEQLGVKGVPNAAEAIIVARDLYLLELVRCRYHVLHISTHQAIDAVRRAKAAGLPVTAEAAPHHFMMTEDEVLRFDTLAKMNPPLRHEKDRLAVIEGIKDGTIDVIATDHAPHEPETKCVPLSDAAFGIVGLETMLTLSLALYHQGLLSLSDVLSKMTDKAADVIGVPAGRLEKGRQADLTLIDVDHQWEINPAAFSSKSKNAPFDAYPVKGRAIKTFVKGACVFSLSD